MTAASEVVPRVFVTSDTSDQVATRTGNPYLSGCHRNLGRGWTPFRASFFVLAPFRASFFVFGDWLGDVLPPGGPLVVTPLPGAEPPPVGSHLDGLRPSIDQHGAPRHAQRELRQKHGTDGTRDG